MANGKKGYLNQGFSQIINLILAIIPFTSWILGAVTRILRGKLLAGVLQLIPPITFIFWVIDIITVVTDGDLTFYA